MKIGMKSSELQFELYFALNKTCHPCPLAESILILVFQLYHFSSLSSSCIIPHPCPLAVSIIILVLQLYPSSSLSSSCIITNPCPLAVSFLVLVLWLYLSSSFVLQLYPSSSLSFSCIICIYSHGQHVSSDNNNLNGQEKP